MAVLYLKRYGMKVLDNGYEVVPITPGTKFPNFDYSHKKLPTIRKKHVKGWLANGHARDGIGIRTRHTPMCDIDCLDKGAREATVAFVEETIGFAPIRVGNAPKLGIMFRSTEPFSKVQSRSYRDPKGRKCQVEFLGDGQQFVALAVHPDTKKPYKWTDKGWNPVNLEWEKLPVVTQEQAQAVCDFFDEYCRSRDWPVWKKKKTSTAVAVRRADDEDDIAGSLDSTPLPFGIDKVREWVNRLPNDESVEYEDSYSRRPDTANYRNVLFAIWHQTDGSDEGREIAWDWSEQSPKHEEEEGRFDKLWNSADHEGRDNAVTFRYVVGLVNRIEEIATREKRDELLVSLQTCTDIDDLKEICKQIALIKFEPMDFEQMAQAVKEAFRRITGKTYPIERARKDILHRATQEEIPEWVQPWVYIQHTMRFFNKETGQEISREAYDASYSRYIDGQSAAFFALNTAKVKCYHLTMYKPDEDEEFVFEGQLCLNIFSDRLMPPMPEKYSKGDRNAIRTVEAHIENIIPNERDRGIFISFLAYVVQTRSRPNWMVILQGVQGDGKSFFADLMGAVLGGKNVRRLDAQQLEDKYTAWAVGQLFCFVEELRLQGHSRFDIYNKIKPYISNAAINIHPKNVNPYTAYNTTAYMAGTNYIDAIPLDDTDRRNFVLKSRWQAGAAIRLFEAENPGYFKKLFDTLNRAGALRRWLNEYPLHEEFEPKGRAPLTEARDQMIEMAKSDVQIAFEDLISDNQEPRIGPELVISNNLIAELGERTKEHISGKGIASLLTANGYVKNPFRIRLDSDQQSKDSVWTRDLDISHASSGAELQRQIRRYLKKRQADLSHEDEL